MSGTQRDQNDPTVGNPTEATAATSETKEQRGLKSESGSTRSADHLPDRFPEIEFSEEAAFRQSAKPIPGSEGPLDEATDAADRKTLPTRDPKDAAAEAVPNQKSLAAQSARMEASETEEAPLSVEPESIPDDPSVIVDVEANPAADPRAADTKEPEPKNDAARTHGSTPPLASSADSIPPNALRSPTDAPVARTKPPPPARQRSGGTTIALLLVASGALFFGIRALRTSDETPAEPAAASGVDSMDMTVDLADPDLQHPALPSRESQGSAEATQGETPELNAEATQPPRLKVTAASNDDRPKPQGASVAKTSNLVQGPKEPEEAETPDSSEANEASSEEQAAPLDDQFNTNAAALALDAAASRASSCRKPGDPSGVATVTITFSQGGRVTTANVSGPPFAGTETGGCIASIMRDARVPPFTGDFFTIRKTVTIQ